MASIENRSRFKVTVQNRDDLTRTFTYSAVKGVKAYIAEMKGKGFKPKASRLNDSFAVRIRQVPLSQTSCRFPDLHGSTTNHEPKPTLQRIPRPSAEQGQTARHA